MPLCPPSVADAQAPALASDPPCKPAAARIDHDSFGHLRIAGGRHDLPVDHRSGVLFLEWTSVAAPIIVDRFGAQAKESVLAAGVGATAISSEQGGLYLSNCTVEGDIVCNGLLGVDLSRTHVKGDIRSPKTELRHGTTVEGRVQIASSSMVVGADCQIKVLEVSPSRDCPDRSPHVTLEEGASVERVICHAPAMTLTLEGDACVAHPLAPCIRVERPGKDDADSDEECAVFEPESCSLQSSWEFGKRIADRDLVVFSSVPPARPGPHNAP